ncbi:unnamed protein product [Closterium sp. NIES-64]|nr:unnamed protein product [Closterium sp. NIES-64]
MAVPATPDAVRHVPADPVAAALAAAAAASPAVKRAELRAAVRELRDRCLFQASSWAAEQPISLPGMPSPQCAGPIANLPPSVYPSSLRLLILAPQSNAMPSQSENLRRPVPLLNPSWFHRAAEQLNGLPVMPPPHCSRPNADHSLIAYPPLLLITSLSSPPPDSTGLQSS